MTYVTEIKAERDKEMRAWLPSVFVKRRRSEQDEAPADLLREFTMT